MIGRHKVIYSPGGGGPAQQEVQIPEPGKHDEAKPVEVPFSGLVPKESEVEVKAGSNEINIELVADSRKYPRSKCEFTVRRREEARLFRRAGLRCLRNARAQY